MVRGELLAERLSSIREGLAADGYDLDVEIADDGSVAVRVSAGPDACEDCLVPKPIFHDLVTAPLADLVDPATVSVHYPVDAEPGDGSAQEEPATSGRPGAPTFASALHEVADWDDVQRLATERGWSDGLPVVPPTPERVAAFLDAAGLRADSVVARMPERDVTVTGEGLAVNAVLAGCAPEHLRLLAALVRAVARPEFKFNHIASLGSPWPLFLVSGPVTAELGLDGGQYLFGDAAGVNAVISRAFSLAMRNLAHARNDGIQRGQWGNPVRWQSIVPESEPSPWPSLASRLGHPEGTSVVKAVSVYPMTPSHITTVDTTPERMLDAACHALATFGGAQWTRGTYVLMIGPHHAEELAGAGWDVERIVDYVREHTRTTVADLKRRGAWGAAKDVDLAEAQRVEPGDEQTEMRLFASNGELDDWIFVPSSVEGRLNDVEVVVAGGDAGRRLAFAAPYQLSSDPVTEVVEE